MLDKVGLIQGTVAMTVHVTPMEHVYVIMDTMGSIVKVSGYKINRHGQIALNYVSVLSQKNTSHINLELLKQADDVGHDVIVSRCGGKY